MESPKKNPYLKKRIPRIFKRSFNRSVVTDFSDIDIEYINKLMGSIQFEDQKKYDKYHKSNNSPNTTNKSKIEIMDDKNLVM